MYLSVTQNSAVLGNYIAARLSPSFLIVGGIILFIALFIAKIIGEYCAKRWNGNENKIRNTCMWIMGITTVLSLLVYSCTIVTIQAIVLCGIYLFSSYSDIKSRELDDYAHCLVLVAGLIGHNITDLPVMLIAALLVGGVTLVVGVISKGGGIGGADIKLSAASAFLLGLQRSLIGIIVGMFLAVVINMIRDKKNKTSGGFPLIPYLAIGFMAAFFIK